MSEPFTYCRLLVTLRYEVRGWTVGDIYGKKPFDPKKEPKAFWHRTHFQGIPITQVGSDRFWNRLGTGKRAVDYEDDDDFVADDPGYQ